MHNSFIELLFSVKDIQQALSVKKYIPAYFSRFFKIFQKKLLTKNPLRKPKRIFL